MTDFTTDIVTYKNCRIVKQTDKAVLIEFEDGRAWCPWSVVDHGSISKDGEVGTVYIREWFARQEGWIE